MLLMGRNCARPRLLKTSYRDSPRQAAGRRWEFYNVQFSADLVSIRNRVNAEVSLEFYAKRKAHFTHPPNYKHTAIAHNTGVPHFKIHSVPPRASLSGTE